MSSFVRSPCFVWDWEWFQKSCWKSIKSLYYSTWIFVNLGAIFGIYETCPKRYLGTPELLWVVSSEAHVSFKICSGFQNVAENKLNPCTIVHGFLSIWLRFSEFTKLAQNMSLGSPEQLGIHSSEAHVLFENSSDFKIVAENQLNPCTIVHGFLSIYVRFSEFTKLVQNVR